MMSETLVNKVAESQIITLDLSDIIPNLSDIVVFDIKPFLFKELILKEKDFREQLKTFDFTAFQNKFVCISNSGDAIIPKWAFMLLATYLNTSFIFVGKPEQALETFTHHIIANLNTADYQDKRVVIKGCGEKPISENAYLAITQKLLPLAKSIMYGEPCSTVPVFKRKYT